MEMFQHTLSVASKLLAIGDDLFMDDRLQPWREYRGELRKLQLVLESFCYLGVDGLDFVMQSLSEAQYEVESCLSKLISFERSATGCGCIFNFVLPSYEFRILRDLERRTESLKHIAQNIGNALEDWIKFRDLAKSLRGEQPSIKSDHLVEDAHFVPLRNYQDLIYAALEDGGDDAPLVIFLYGKHGMGKTSIAWHTAASVGRVGGNQEAPHTLSSFRYVFFMSCGHSVRSKDVETELKLRLRLGPKAKSTDISITLGGAKTLVVLDDVQDPDIPRDVIQLGRHSRNGSKIIITSTHETLCEECDHNMICKIYIDTVSKDQAREILASHTGLLPPEEIMDTVISETEGIPLALAHLGSLFNKNSTNDQQEWKDALTHLHKASEREGLKIVPRMYPTSFSSMMRLEVDSLDTDAKLLFLFICISKLEPLLEKDIQFLYTFLGLGTGKVFRDASSHLEARHFISIREIDQIVSWHIHPLMKLFVQRGGVGIETTKEMQRKISRWDNEGSLPPRSIATLDDMGNFIDKLRNAVNGSIT